MAQQIKAVFFDIDGTLTSFTTHEVPQSTKDAIETLKSKGVRVFIATGRAPSQMTIVTRRLASSVRRGGPFFVFRLRRWAG
ncbi:hypothetical protein DF200_05355 [Bifidobacterium catulorum]|uniref:Hydrolase n=1 Tax=Bifidobacterium catulorum TaxID=1630173 RepID=A0A2U2MSM0_9BIFI|nr:hypothetical protein DF200_05355 [Bifidobacterium catulorum]